tara:strand:- start:478 stop:753 length:276 start_codon:yes stop_codon:yes gene_type:complete
MPKFTLTKFPEVSEDSTVSVTFETDSLPAAQAHFEDFLRASGFEIQDLEADDLESIVSRMAASSIPSISEWEWDDDGELRSDLRDRFRIIK